MMRPPVPCPLCASGDCHTRCVAAAILNYTSQLQSGDISNPRDAMPVVPPPKGLAERVAASAEQLDRLTSLGLGRSGHVPPLRAALDVLGGAEEAEESAMQAAASVLLEHLKGSSDSGSDPDPTVLDPTVALMFLVHFVGDIHQVNDSAWHRAARSLACSPLFVGHARCPLSSPARNTAQALACALAMLTHRLLLQ